MVMTMKVTPIEESRKSGSLLMDAPPHCNKAELASLAGDQDSEEGTECMTQWQSHCADLVPEMQRSSVSDSASCE